jgi:hypothetical protein
MGKRTAVYTVLVREPEGIDYLGYRGVDGSIILRWIFRKWDVGAWTVLSWLRIGTGVGHL